MIERDLYADIPNVTGITSINVTSGYNQSSAVATVTCESTTLTLNSIITIDAGYSDEHQQIFYGRVKDITRNREEGNLTIVAKDMLVDATDFFIVADNPEDPFKRQNISAEDLIGDLLGLAGITSYVPNVPLSFTYGVSVPAEFNLLTVMDACNQVATVLAWHIYADVTTVRFEDVRPYYRLGSKKDTDYGKIPGTMPDDIISHSFCSDGSIVSPANTIKTTIKTIERTYSDEGLRNKVVVYGRDNLVKKAQVASPYLPVGFYKTAVIASPLIDSDEMAQAAADYNLDLYNRLSESCTLGIMGNSSVKPRQFIEVSDTFTGCTGALPVNRAWFVQQVSHTLSANGFETKLTCSR